MKKSNQSNLDRVQTVGVIGFGYVGLPLVIDFCQAGFKVTGFDIDVAKVESIYNGQSYISYISPATISVQVESGLLTPTTDYTRLKN